IFVAHSIKRMLDHLVEDGEAAIRAGHAAMAKIRRMRSLALQCGLPEDDIEYMEYTFGLVALAREYFFRPDDEGMRARLGQAKKRYKRRDPRGSRFRYSVKYDFKPFKLGSRSIGLCLKYLVRRSPDYRFIDKIIG